MRLRTRAVLTATVALVTGGIIGAAPAGAITGGEVDDEGQFPNVGIIAFYTDEGRFRCSATLIDEDLLLTAAHCTEGTVGKTIVSFEWFIDDAPPSNLPRAADDEGDGTSEVGYGTTTSGSWLSGTAVTHPEYSGFTDLDNWNDVGVVVLDRPVTGIAPAALAPENYLEQFRQPRLNKTEFTVVGYGTEVRQAEEGPQKPTPMSYPILRRYTDVIGQKLTSQILQVNGNEHDNRAGGGSCFGDSGGPTFKNDYVVTVTSYGYTDNCRYIDGLQRVDIPVVRDWVTGFVD
jgi:hypothetical protein